MDEMRILIAEGDTSAREILATSLSRKGYAVYTATNGRQAIGAIESLLPDVAVLSIALPLIDGFGVLEYFRAKPLRQYPFMLVTTAMGPEIIEKALRLGADEAVAKPVSPEALNPLLQGLKARQVSNLALLHAAPRQSLVLEQLTEIGMRENLKGFAYLTRAVALVSADERLLRQATRGLYPFLATEYHVTDHSVERAIRHAIEATWTRGNMDALHRVFGNSIDPQRGKPTNTECIAMLAQALCGQLNMEE